MEQLIIFLLFVVASIVSSIIQKKKRAQEEEAARRDLERPLPQASGNPAPPPVTRWPRSAQDWQEQLRKMLEENAPPVIKPVLKPVISEKQPRPAPVTRPISVKVLPPVEKSEGDLEYQSPLRESASAHQRASSLQARIEKRFKAVDEQTTAHRTVASSRADRPGHAFVRKLRRRPAALREAFIASLIFSPPKSLEQRNEEAI